MNTSKIVMHLFEIAGRCGYLVHMAIDIGLNGAGDGLLPRPVYRLLVHDRLGQLVGGRGGREVEQEVGWKIRRY